MRRHVFPAVAFIVTACSVSGAQTLVNEPARAAAEAAPAAGVSWFDQLWDLPLLRLFAPVSVDDSLVAGLPAPPAPAVPACAVQPLPVLADEEALSFEAKSGVGPVVDVEGLRPGAQSALMRFERAVTSVGGSIYLTSAYRPLTYQQHLQAVWDKWMTELRYETDPACHSLREDVRLEFEKHQLLERQRPVSLSDHTLGIGFDAAVALPARTRARRRLRLSLDRLAKVSGLLRPDVFRDPVHFRLIGGRV